MWKENPFSRIFVESEESKKKKKTSSPASRAGVSKKKNVLFKCVYIGLVHRRRKERYTHRFSRGITRERITAFRRSYSPVVVPGFRFRVPAFVHRVFESSGGGAALTKRKQLSFASLALVFPRRNAVRLRLHRESRSFSPGNGGKFARCCAVKCNMHEWGGGEGL